MRQRLRAFLLRQIARAQRFLNPPRDLAAENRYLHRRLDEATVMQDALEKAAFSDARERISELVEARAMIGSGPWRVGPETAMQTQQLINVAMESLGSPNANEYFRERALQLRETTPLLAQGAFGDIELALQNVEWRREVNLSWLEFSRWGIQQIILISRLFYIKNSTIQRGVNVSAQYVFGRGVEVSSPDPDANDVIRDFMHRNRGVLGQVALTDLERRKYYDGNLFFALFTDAGDSGEVIVRTIDATEIMDIVTDPGDTDTPWFYRRQWTERNFNAMNGQTTTAQKEEWYPALGYEPTGIGKVPKINDKRVNWGTPVYHRKSGAIAKWHFGVPLVYAALDWARASRRWLEACATVRQALAQISMILTSKGGQAALEQQKAGLATTVGPQSSLWDQNPTAVNAAIFGSGPGTTLQAFKTQGAGGDPEEVRRFELMVWRVFGIPETFGGDVKTGNLATATSLDRPTELNFLEKQEAWREDLNVLAQYQLRMSAGATSGRLFEALRKRNRGFVPKNLVIMEARRVYRETGLGNMAVRYEASAPSDAAIETMVTFPSIREGDIPQLVKAITDAMTLGNTQGTVVGIDERAGVRKLYEVTGIENGDELIDQQYPDKGKDKYDPLRTKDEPPPAPVPPAPGAPTPEPTASKAQESLRRLMEAARRISNRAA
jgi:hypothetical protein